MKIITPELLNRFWKNGVKPIKDDVSTIKTELEEKLDIDGNASDVTNTFSQASARTNLATNEKLSASLGKIMKWFTDLKAIAFSGSAADITQSATHRFVSDTEKAAWNGKQDTKNTAGSTDSSSKLFLVGTTSQGANPQTYSHDTVYAGTDGHVYSNGKQSVNLSDPQALTGKTYNGYTLTDACAKGISDSSAAAALGTGTNLVTERDVYHGLPKLNNAHTYTSSSNYYAPTDAGASGQLLKSSGGAPTWGTLTASEVKGALGYTAADAADMTEINTKLSQKAPTSHASTGTTYGLGSASMYGHAMASSAAPLAAGTVTAGTDNGKYAREGHVHPAQTTVSGNAGTATKLATARALTIGSTAKNFDGSGNVGWTLGEIGAAASSHTHNYLPLSGGNMTGTIRSSDGSAILNLNGSYGITTNSEIVCNNTCGLSGNGGTRFLAYYSGGCQIGEFGYPTFVAGTDWTLYFGSGVCRPAADYSGDVNLGNSASRWKQLYATNATISTSDRNEKNSIQDIPEAYENLFMQIAPKVFKRNGGDRIHVGAISQDIESALGNVGMSPEDFSGFCRDLVVNYTYDEDGNEIEALREPILDENGDKQYTYGLRYEEFIMLNTHMIQKIMKYNNEQEEYTKALESRVKILEDTVTSYFAF